MNEFWYEIVTFYTKVLIFIGLIYFMDHACIANADSKVIKVAVLDTGLNGRYTGFHLCPKGHFDFTTKEDKIGFDFADHGTKVLQLIEGEQNQMRGYCFLIYKVGHFKAEARWALRAFKYAKKQGAVLFYVSYIPFKQGIINEQQFVLDNPQLNFVVAAGNQSKELECNAPCVLLPNVILVGAIDPDTGEQAWYSNYGPAVRLNMPARGGTDYAAAVATGQIIKKALNLRSGSADYIRNQYFTVEK